MDRAPACGAVDRRFESCQEHNIKKAQLGFFYNNILTFGYGSGNLLSAHFIKTGGENGFGKD